MTPLEATAAGLQAAELQLIALDEIPEAATYASLRDKLGIKKTLTESEIANFLIERGFTNGQIASLLDGFDKIDIQAVQEGANEVIAIHLVDTLESMYNAMYCQKRFNEITSIVADAIENYWQDCAEESAELAAKNY